MTRRRLRPTDHRATSLHAWFLILLVAWRYSIVDSTFIVAHHHNHRKTSLSRSIATNVVANPEMDELEEQEERKKKTSSWIPTKNGGYLPNLGKTRIQTVTTLEDYKKVVADEESQLVVVRFYAPWCRACKAVAPAFRKLSFQFPSVKFVECPLTQDNAFLHTGLGVPKLPYGHLYHPTAGLVEEKSLNRKVLSDFVQILQQYVDESCPLDDDDDDDEEEEEEIKVVF